MQVKNFSTNLTTPSCMKDGEIGIVRICKAHPEKVGHLVHKYRDTTLIMVGQESNSTWQYAEKMHTLSEVAIEIIKAGEVTLVVGKITAE